MIMYVFPSFLITEKNLLRYNIAAACLFAFGPLFFFFFSNFIQNS